MPNVEAPNGYPPEIEPPESSILPAPGDRYEVFRQKMDRIIAEVSVSFACDDGMYEGYEDRSQVGG